MARPRRVPSATVPVVVQATAAVARRRTLHVQELPRVAETIDGVSAPTLRGLDAGT